jgi:hypothetical protein
MARRQKKIRQRIERAKIKHADNPYLENILRRIENDPKYREIRIRYQNQIVCFYCGFPASGVDHQPPLSRIDEYIKVRKAKKRPIHLLKVSCCGECNRLLGNSVFSSFEAKLENLRRRLKKKYARITPEDKLQFGRLKRRLTFNRGLKRVRRYE